MVVVNGWDGVIGGYRFRSLSDKKQYIYIYFTYQEKSGRCWFGVESFEISSEIVIGKLVGRIVENGQGLPLRLGWGKDSYMTGRGGRLSHWEGEQALQKGVE